MGEKKQVVKCDKYTMKVVGEYPSVPDAAKATGEDKSGIRAACIHRRVGWQGHVWRYADDYDPNETFENKSNRPVYVFDTVTKAVAAFDTLSAASRKTGLRYAVLSSSINRHWHAGGRFVVKYAR